MPAPRYFRRATFVVVALVVAFSLFVRAQQYLFRQQVDRLHREILALQLHSGNFADIQRLQREWGAYAHYNGPCTPHHCIYQITLYDGLDNWFKNPSDPFPYFEAMRTRFILKAYAFFGGRPGYAVANVRVRDDQMWGADFAIGIATYPGKGRNEGEPYMVLAGIQSGSRLSGRNDSSSDALRRGFRTESGLNCLGCEFVEVFLTPQTEVRDIERFNQFNFSCITAIWACKDPVDIAPDAWNEGLKENEDKTDSEKQLCRVPPTILAREANDIVLAKVQSLEKGPKPDPGPPNQWVTVQIIKLLKNGRTFPIASNFEFVAGPYALRRENENTPARLVAGNEYFFLYRRPSLYELSVKAIFDPCHILAKTSESAASIQEGIALDPSNGEPYNFRNEPYTER